MNSEQSSALFSLCLDTGTGLFCLYGYKFECVGWNIFSSLNTVISTNESTQSIRGHVIYNPAYTYKVQLKTMLI